MTAANKHKLLAGGAVVLVILLLLLLRGRQGNTLVQQSPLNLPGLTIPGFNFTPVRGAFQLPSMGVDPANFSMIGACCSDCSGAAPVSYRPARSGPTFVFNEGNKGPNVYIYVPPPAPKIGKGPAGGVIAWGG